MKEGFLRVSNRSWNKMGEVWVQYSSWKGARGDSRVIRPGCHPTGVYLSLFAAKQSGRGASLVIAE